MLFVAFIFTQSSVIVKSKAITSASLEIKQEQHSQTVLELPLVRPPFVGVVALRMELCSEETA